MLDLVQKHQGYLIVFCSLPDQETETMEPAARWILGDKPNGAATGRAASKQAPRKGCPTNEVISQAN